MEACIGFVLGLLGALGDQVMTQPFDRPLTSTPTLYKSETLWQLKPRYSVMKVSDVRLTMLIGSNLSGQNERTGCWSDTPDKKDQEQTSQARRYEIMRNGSGCLCHLTSAPGAR